MGAVDPPRRLEDSEAVTSRGVPAGIPVGGRASSGGGWLSAVLAALAAGLVTWLATERGMFLVEPAMEKITIMGQESVGATGKTRMAAAVREVSGANATLGFLLGAG